MKKILLNSCLLSTLFVSSISYAACSTSTKVDSIYLNNGNGTVTDNVTGLMWAQCTDGLSDATCTTGFASTHNWADAFAAVKAANASSLMGHNDWRLPNVKELLSIIDKGCDNPATNSVLFPATQPGGYWSSSPDKQDNQQSYSVDFTSGSVDVSLKFAPHYVRLVRLGE